MALPTTDLTGQRFGNWRVSSETPPKVMKGKVHWLCECTCGTTQWIAGTTLKRGTTLGCAGCRWDRYRDPTTDLARAGNKRKDLSGLRLGILAVTDQWRRTQTNNIEWFCRCDCGTERWIRAGQLYNKKHPPRSCGCMRTMQDLAGQRFGKWSVLDEIERRPARDGKRQHDKVFWKCRCECGAERFVLGSDLRRGVSKSCGCGVLKGHGDITGTKWRLFIASAEIRNIPFLISIEYGWQLFIEQGARCALSGVTLTFPTTAKTVGTASLDRIDSKRPYEVGNVQWVHKDVNVMKSDLSDDTFIEWCRKVATHSTRRSSHPSPTVAP